MPRASQFREVDPRLARKFSYRTSSLSACPETEPLVVLRNRIWFLRLLPLALRWKSFEFTFPKRIQVRRDRYRILILAVLQSPAPSACIVSWSHFHPLLTVFLLVWSPAIEWFGLPCLRVISNAQFSYDSMPSMLWQPWTVWYAISWCCPMMLPVSPRCAILPTNNLPCVSMKLQNGTFWPVYSTVSRTWSWGSDQSTMMR